MKDKRCFICKYQGVTDEETYKERIYRKSNKNLTILLCIGHSIEIFRTGQIKFMAKYKPNFVDFTSADEDQAIINYF